MKITLKIKSPIMKKVAIVVLLLCSYAVLRAQQPSGDYTLDSIWFECQCDGFPMEVNGIKTHYTGGFWLYPRPSQVSNLDWENQQMSRTPWQPWQNIDTTANRGITERLNVVKITNPSGTESVYSYRLSRDSALIKRVEIYVDSLDLFGPEGFYGPGAGMQRTFPRPEWVWNYSLNGDDVELGFINRDRIEKPALIYYSDTLLRCGIRVSGNSGLNYYNKSLAVVARDTYGTNRFPSIYPGYEVPQKWLKFRSGGSGQMNNFGANEFVHKALYGLGISDCPVEPVEVYLNGSYWTLAFCQPKLDEYFLQQNYGVNRDSVTLASIAQFNSINPIQINAAITAGIDTSKFIMVSINNAVYISKMVDHGSTTVFEKAIQPLLNNVDSLIFEQGQPVDFVVSNYALDSIVDMVAMARYLTSVDFFQVTDAIHNNTHFWIAPGTKISPLVRDFDSGMLLPVDSSLWHKIFGRQDQASLGGLLVRLIEKDPEDLILVYQDLVNHKFNCDRLESAAASLVQAVRYGYSKMFISWGGYPNGGADTSYQEIRNQTFLNWCNQRPAAAITGLAQYFMPEKGWDYTNQQEVCLVIDPGYKDLGLKVFVNTLAIDSSWCGMYYPAPCLKIHAEVPDGYTLSWLEFPDSSQVFRLCATSAQTLTPILSTAPSSIAELDNGFGLAPNPTNGSFRVFKRPNEVCSVYDAVGRIVVQTTDSDITLIQKGVYLVKIGDNKPKKLIVQ